MIKDKAKFLKSIIDVSHVEFQSYDFYHRHLIFSSGVAEKILGYSKEEFKELSKNYYVEIIHPDDQAIVKENADRIFLSLNGEIIEMTVRMKKSDGSYIWVYSRKIVSERNSDGTPFTITTIAEDITELMITQEQLKEKVKQLESISFRNSHIVRAPVASIIGLIDMIEEKNITSSHNIKVFNYLKIAIKKLDEIIHEINDIAKT